MQELTGRPAEKVMAQRTAEAAQYLADFTNRQCHIGAGSRKRDLAPLESGPKFAV